MDAAGGPDGFRSSSPFVRRRSSGWDRSGRSDGRSAARMGPAATGAKLYPLKPQLWHLEDALLPAVTPRPASVFLRDGGELAVVTAVHAAIERGEHATFATAPPAALGRRCCVGSHASTRRSYRTAATTGWRRWGRRGRWRRGWRAPPPPHAGWW